MANNKLFIGGISWDTTDESLKAAFSQFGVVTDAKVILDKETQRSRGFGFVTFQEENDAKEAMSKMDGAELDGRQIRANEANERPQRGGGVHRRDDGGGGGYNNDNTRGGYNDDREKGGRGRDRGDRWDKGGGGGRRGRGDR